MRVSQEGKSPGFQRRKAAKIRKKEKAEGKH